MADSPSESLSPDSTPSQSSPAESTSSESSPSESSPSESSPSESSPSESSPSESSPSESTPSESAPSDSTPSESAPSATTSESGDIPMDISEESLHDSGTEESKLDAAEGTDVTKKVEKSEVGPTKKSIPAKPLETVLEKLEIEKPEQLEMAALSEEQEKAERKSVGTQTRAGPSSSVDMQTDPDAGFEDSYAPSIEDEDAIEKLTAAIWGPYATCADTEFYQIATTVDYSDLNVDVTIIQHYQYWNCCFLRKLIEGYLIANKNLLVDEDDVIIASFPRAGSTWVQQMVYYLYHPDELEKSSNENIDVRVPLIEFPECTFEVLMQRQSPKLLKTHLPYQFLNFKKGDNKFKIVYIARNPKDVAVSYFHFYKMMSSFHFNGNLDDFLHMFFNDRVHCCPFPDHVYSYFNKSDRIHFLTYEKLQKDTVGELKNIAAFLKIEADDGLLKKIVDKCSFENMQADPLSNHAQWAGNLNLARVNELKFMRKGKVGDWRNYLSDPMKEFDDWIHTYFTKHDFEFEYDPPLELAG